MPPTKRPGASRRSGSKRSFSARMRSMDGGGGAPRVEGGPDGGRGLADDERPARGDDGGAGVAEAGHQPRRRRPARRRRRRSPAWGRGPPRAGESSPRSGGSQDRAMSARREGGAESFTRSEPRSRTASCRAQKPAAPGAGEPLAGEPGLAPPASRSRATWSATPASNPSKRTPRSSRSEAKMATAEVGSSCAARQAGGERPDLRRRRARGRGRWPRSPGAGARRKVTLGEERQRPERAHHEARQVEAGHVLHHLGAAPGGRPVGADDGDAEDEVARRAEAGAPRAEGVGRHHAAHRGPVRERGVERQPLPVPGEHLGAAPPSVMPASAVTTWSAGAWSTRRERAPVRSTASSRDGRPPRPRSVPPPTKATASRSAAARAMASAASSTVAGSRTRRGTTPCTASAAVPGALARHHRCTSPDFTAGCSTPPGPGFSPQSRSVGKTLPGLKASSGSKAERTHFMVSRSASPYMSAM